MVVYYSVSNPETAVVDYNNIPVWEIVRLGCGLLLIFFGLTNVIGIFTRKKNEVVPQ
ncbi:MAG: hypothetical protein HQL18_04725 [Candidatus Omnitrophica bacterium]|nr:hypothetical protein [Candidatus Omnitrophota bacterium]